MDINEQMQNRIDKMHKLEERGIRPFGHRFDWTHHTKEIYDNVEQMEADGTVVKAAGRVMAIRGHGKTSFIDLQDSTGKIQLYTRKDILGEDNTAKRALSICRTAQGKSSFTPAKIYWGKITTP